MLKTNISFLSYIESLASTPEYCDKIVLTDFSPKVQLLHQGETVNKIIVIKEGITKCFITEENGKEYIPEFLSQGEIMGEVEIMSKKTCLASVETLTKVAAYIIPKTVFEHLLRTDITFNNVLLEIEANRLYATSQKASFQQSYTVEHALEKLLSLLEDQQIPISKEDMASYLGITTRTLNRAMKKPTL